MYFVYRVDICGKTYIGCTNNLRRRKDQHNGNSRKRASKFGEFLNDNNIVLKTTDLQIIASYELRDDALKAERAISMSLAKEIGDDLLNDNYSLNCTRKGKNVGRTTKQYVLVDMVEHTATKISGLRQYCIANDLNYKNIQRTTVNEFSTCGNRYKVFSKEQWDSYSDKEQQQYIEGLILEVTEKRIREATVKSCSKTYEVMLPTGELVIVNNLDKFAREHGINPGNLHASLTNDRTACGYKAIRRI